MGIFGTSSTPFDQQLDKATDECNTAEDWGLIMSICDKVKTTQDGPKEFCKAILRKINHRVPHVALQALTVLDSCVNNCGIEFKKEVASQDFINQLRAAIANGHAKVASQLKMLIRQWAEDFKDDPQLSRLTSFYHFMRSEGMEFPTPEEINPKKKSAPVSKDPNVVSSQQEADDIAKAIEMSLNEEKQKKSLSGSLGTSTSSAPVSSLYPSMLGGGASTSTLQSTSYTSGSPAAAKKTVKAIYDFEAAEDNELTFKAGDLIKILDDSDANWWKGEGSNGTGLFPANFVTTDLSVEPEPEFGVAKHDEEDEDGDGRAVSFNEEVEIKEVDQSEPVLEIDESLMDDTLLKLQNTDPESSGQDSAQLLQGEDSCTQMGPLIDAKLEDVDRKHLEYSQLNDKILEALNMYDKLMNEMPAYNPAATNPYMKAQSLTHINPYAQQMAPGQHPSYAAGGHPGMYGPPQGQMQQVPSTGASGPGSYNMYQHQNTTPGSVNYPSHNGVQHSQQQQGMTLPMNQQTQPSGFPQQVYSDSSIHSSGAYSNQGTVPQQQYAAGYGQPSQAVTGQPYNPAPATMQPLM